MILKSILLGVLVQDGASWDQIERRPVTLRGNLNGMTNAPLLPWAAKECVDRNCKIEKRFKEIHDCQSYVENTEKEGVFCEKVMPSHSRSP